MIIIRDIYFIAHLYDILRNIANDKPSAARTFEKELNCKIRNLLDFPYQYRASRYFKESAYRDLIHKGYTIIYKVEKERIVVLEIFKWQNR
jgi:plasmid stabilization system protein ParE